LRSSDETIHFSFVGDIGDSKCRLPDGAGETLCDSGGGDLGQRPVKDGDGEARRNTGIDARNDDELPGGG
jgi:hypothetical protein